IVRGAAGTGGYAPLIFGNAEPYLIRGDLGPPAIPRNGKRGVIASFAQLTDIHAMDVQTPARFEFLDPFRAFVSDLANAYRPPELLSAQVGEAMIRQIRNVGRGPASGQPLQFA